MELIPLASRRLRVDGISLGVKVEVAGKKPETKTETKVEEKPAVATFECPQVPGLMLSGEMCSAATCSGECKAYKEFKEGQKK